jgi:hypothetical protein
MVGPGYADVLRHHSARPAGLEPAAKCLEDVADVGGWGPACRGGSDSEPAEAAVACRRRSLPHRRG